MWSLQAWRVGGSLPGLDSGGTCINLTWHLPALTNTPILAPLQTHGLAMVTGPASQTPSKPT